MTVVYHDYDTHVGLWFVCLFYYRNTYLLTYLLTEPYLSSNNGVFTRHSLVSRDVVLEAVVLSLPSPRQYLPRSCIGLDVSASVLAWPRAFCLCLGSRLCLGISALVIHVPASSVPGEPIFSHVGLFVRPRHARSIR